LGLRATNELLHFPNRAASSIPSISHALKSVTNDIDIENAWLIADWRGWPGRNNVAPAMRGGALLCIHKVQAHRGGALPFKTTEYCANAHHV
jgi:hypothetical protein